MKPRIAIPIPTTGDAAYNQLNWPAYADAVAASGGEPVRFALGVCRREAMAAAMSCQGILLPGSPADVAPAKYGRTKDEATASPDEARELLDEGFIELAERSSRPLLAICFGAQILNVSRGGTLIQDLSVFPVNHSAGRSVGVAHTVAVEKGAFLEGLVDAREMLAEGQLPVNSSHHQAIAIPGAGLRVSARCPQDGVIEAVEDTLFGGFMVGLQWHPERTFSSSATSRALFSRFVEASAVWRDTEVLATA